jgi:hypothetical protein
MRFDRVVKFRASVYLAQSRADATSLLRRAWPKLPRARFALRSLGTAILDSAWPRVVDLDVGW